MLASSGRRSPTRASWGTASLSISSRSVLSPEDKFENPVALPPGRARLATRPAPTGSPMLVITMGMVVVAFFAANAGTADETTIRSTFRRTRSAASSGRRSFFCSANRYSMVMFFPSIHPSLLSSCRNASKKTAILEAVLLSRKPMRVIFSVCCASIVELGSRCREQSARQNVFLVICVVPALFSYLRPLTSDLRLLLLDHFISSRKHVRRNRQTDLLCCLQIDDELKLLWLLHGKIGRLSAFQNLVHKSRGAPIQVVSVHAVAHQPPGFHKICLVVYPWEPALCRELCNLRSMRNEDVAVQQEDCVSTPLACGSECSLKILGI